MNVTRLNDPQAFLEQAHELLLAAEARNNLILGIASTIADNPGFYTEHSFWLVEEAGRLVGAALRTPPHNLVLADMGVEVAQALADALRGEDLPGVVGLVPAVDAFAAGRATELVMAQGAFALETVADLPRPAGAARAATQSDRDVVLRWWREFVEEAFPPGEAPPGDQDRNVDLRLSGTGRGLWLWEADGEPVSMSGWGGRTPNGIRIGPVYTPPAQRGHGYATALVADLSQHLLAEGRRFCFLYTDLTNPTSNAIYERIGYRRVADSKELRFVSS